MSANSSRRYPPELRERAVRMVAEIRDQHETEWAAMSAVVGVARCRDHRDGAQVGAPGRDRCRCASGSIDRGVARSCKRLQRENAELKRANVILGGVDCLAA